MLGYFVKRVLQVIPVLFIISFICFMMIRLVPGDPVVNMLGLGASKEAIAAQREELGLDRPLLVQYKDFLVDALHGDLGTSIITRKPVVEEIIDRYPATLKLAVGGTLFASVVGILFGMISAVWHNKAADNIIMVFSLLAVSTPSFFLALVMMLIFSIWLGVLPSMGLRTPLHYILPIITLGMQSVGMIARTTRSSMLEVLGQDYIKTAKAKGLSYGQVIRRHTLKNAITPVITVAGTMFAGTIVGSFVVENIFNIPGMGKYLVNAVKESDYTVILGMTAFYAIILVAVTFIVDILYVAVDRRVKLD